MIARLEQLGARRERHRGSPAWRTMPDLGMAVRHRTARGDLSGDSLHDMAALTDELAQKIERIR